MCREKIRVPKGKIITFQGVNSPVLVWGDTAGSSGSTENSASTTILADDFIATGVVFQVAFTLYHLLNHASRAKLTQE